MSQPFLSIVTRHLPARKRYFERCALSIVRQSDQDYEHVVLDCLPSSYQDCNTVFYPNRHRVTGKYVFILDDDDYLINLDFVKGLKEQAVNDPDVIWVKWRTIGTFDNVPLPFPEQWEQLSRGLPPIMGTMGSSNFVVRNQLYQDYIKHSEENWMCGDYTFIAAIYAAIPNLRITMWDEFGAAYDHIGHLDTKEEDLCTNL